jgi:hypothetical protein
VRRHPPQVGTLVERLAHSPELAVREVAEAAVHEARRAARRAAREIAALDERDLQPSGDGVERDAGAGDPAADDEDVEALSREALEVPLARAGRELIVAQNFASVQSSPTPTSTASGGSSG